MTRIASAALALAASFLSFSVTLPAQAQDRLPDVQVSAAGLDLASPAGLAALDARIAGAAERACGSVDGTRDLGMIRLAKACHAAKIAEAQAARTALLAAAATPRPAIVAAAR